MWVQSAVCADVARCGSGMSGMWAWLSRQLHYNGEAIISLLLGMGTKPFRPRPKQRRWSFRDLGRDMV